MAANSDRIKYRSISNVIIGHDNDSDQQPDEVSTKIEQPPPPSSSPPSKKRSSNMVPFKGKRQKTKFNEDGAEEESFIQFSSSADNSASRPFRNSQDHKTPRTPQEQNKNGRGFSEDRFSSPWGRSRS